MTATDQSLEWGLKTVLDAHFRWVSAQSTGYSSNLRGTSCLSLWKTEVGSEGGAVKVLLAK